MAELIAALDDALEGRGGLVMLVGEPGIGKTRLTEELAAIARDRGALVAWGAYYEGGSTPPYWAWIQAIRSLLTEPSEAILAALEARAAVIAEIVPEIRDMLPDIQPAPEVDPGQARFRLFDSVTSFLKEAAVSRPLVVVLDDLHWADRSTLDLLEFVARDISSNPMLIIGGYRDVELSRRHPLSETLASLARVRGFQRILLRGLGSTDVRHLIEAVGDIALPTELIDEISERTEGNPFFVTEVTRDLSREAADRGGEFDAVKFRVPEGVREAIGIRLNRLSEECNQVLQTAAVIGREFDFALLAALSQDLSDDALLGVIDEAIGAGVVRQASGPIERYEFTHALIQQTLAEELTAGRRVRLHVRIVGALEELYADRLDEHVIQLAHHCAEAETVVGEDKVVRYARMAGERAAAAYAWIEARAYFEQALAALGEDAPDAQRAAIMFGLGQAELQTLSYPEIQRGWDRVALSFDLYEKLGDPLAAMEVVLRSWGYAPHWINGSARVFSRALELASPNSAEAGHLLLQYGSAIRVEEEDITASLNVLDQALQIARRNEDTHLEAQVLETMTWSRINNGDFLGTIEAGLKAIELARETEQPTMEVGAHFIVAQSLITLGESDAAWRHTETQRKIAEKQPQSSAEIGVFWNQYTISYLRGDRKNINDLGDWLGHSTPDDSVIRLFVGIGGWHTEKRSDLGDVIQSAQETAQIDPLIRQRATSVGFLGLAARLMDQTQAAIRAGELARSILSMPKLTPASEAGALIAAGMAAVATHDVQEADAHHQRLKTLIGTLVFDYPLSADRFLGLLAHTAGMQDEAASHFEDALEFCGSAGYRLEATWTCHDYAEFLLSSSDPVDIEKAVSLIDDGLEISRELGLVSIEKRLAVLQVKADGMSGPSPSYPAGLTQREVEVLRLMAQGKTTREIAGELVISPRTVQRHTTNLYVKIGARNRVEATAFALSELAIFGQAPPDR